MGHGTKRKRRNKKARDALKAVARGEKGPLRERDMARNPYLREKVKEHHVPIRAWRADE